MAAGRRVGFRRSNGDGAWRCFLYGCGLLLPQSFSAFLGFSFALCGKTILAFAFFGGVFAFFLRRCECSLVILFLINSLLLVDLLLAMPLCAVRLPMSGVGGRTTTISRSSARSRIRNEVPRASSCQATVRDCCVHREAIPAPGCGAPSPAIPSRPQAW